MTPSTARSVPLALLAALALPLGAEAQAPKTVAAPLKEPVLVMKTARQEPAGGLAMALHQTQDFPQLGAGEHWVMTVGGDKKLVIETAKGDVGLMQITADPGALMDLFAEQIEAAKPMVRGALTVGLQPQGIPAKDIAAFVDELFAWPRQVQRATLKVVGDPEAVAQTGLDVTFELEPKAGPLAATVAMLVPCEQGVPVFEGQPGAALQLQGSLSPDSVQKLGAPLMALVARISSQGDEQQKQAAELYDRMIKLYDGGFSAAFGVPLAGHMLVGMVDADATRKLVDSDAYVAVMKGQKMPNRDMSLEITPNAFEHRGVKALRSRLTNDGEPNPMMPEGKLDSLFAVVGSYFAGTIGGKETDAKALFDAGLDKKVKRVPIADGNVLSLAIDIHALAEAVGAMPDDETPAAAKLTLGKHDQALRLHVHVK